MKNTTIKSYRCSNKFRLLMFFAMVLICLVAYLNYIDDKLNLWLKVGSLLLVPVAILGFIDSIYSKLFITDQQLLVTSNFRTKSFNKFDVINVKKEGGTVFIQMKDSGWVKLQFDYANSQSICNTIRAWIKRNK